MPEEEATAADRAAARRARILAKKSARLAYAAGSRESRPSTAEAEAVPEIPPLSTSTPRAPRAAPTHTRQPTWPTPSAIPHLRTAIMALAPLAFLYPLYTRGRGGGGAAPPAGVAFAPLQGALALDERRVGKRGELGGRRNS